MSGHKHAYQHAPLTHEELDRLAELARLALSSEERAALQKDMEAILDHVDELGAVQHESVAPYMLESQGPGELRADEVIAGLGIEEAMAAVPERIGDCFSVPKVIG